MNAHVLTRADLWILVIAVLIVGAIVTLYFLPGYLADRKRWAEQVERPTYPADDVQRALQHLRNQRKASR